MPLPRNYMPRPKTNPACPAETLHGTATAYRKPPVGKKCTCADALAAIEAINERDREAAEARRAEAKRIAAGGSVNAPPAPAPSTPTRPDVETRSEVFDGNRRPLCKDDPELFFPVGDEGPAERQRAEAKAICRACPLQRPCLELALSMKPAPIGVWGASDEDERDAIRRGPASARTA